MFVLPGCLFCLCSGSVFELLSVSGCNQSAEDVIAEQAKQQDDDPFANLSKKEKKKKKKQVITL